MCGRYALFRWNPTFAALPGFPADQQAQWNISPNDSVLIQRLNDGQRTLARARWGLTPPWLTDLSRTPAHARAETLAEQPMFREAFRQRRCLLPANGFYEWRGTQRKRPYWLTPGEGSTLFFAAIWEAYPVQEQGVAEYGSGDPGRPESAPAVDSGRGGAGRLARSRDALACVARLAGQ